MFTDEKTCQGPFQQEKYGVLLGVSKKLKLTKMA
jgi:hypothetical protein